MAPAYDEPGEPEPVGPASDGRPLSALPSVQARALAFAAILVAGICGALIGRGVAGVGCTRHCTTPEGIGGVAGAIFAAGGVAVIAVLVLRAMGEWRTIKEERALAEAAAAAAAEAAGADDEPPEGPAPNGPAEPVGGTG